MTAASLTRVRVKSAHVSTRAAYASTWSAATLADLVETDDGEGTAEYRAWMRRQKRRLKRRAVRR